MACFGKDTLTVTCEHQSGGAFTQEMDRASREEHKQKQAL